MRKINFYKKKYQALQSFYAWVDYGSEYDLAVEQALYYRGCEWEEIDEIIVHITIATRYARSGKNIAEDFKERLESTIPKAKMLNLKEYGLTDDEIKVFKEDIKEAESLI